MDNVLIFQPLFTSFHSSALPHCSVVVLAARLLMHTGCLENRQRRRASAARLHVHFSAVASEEPTATITLAV